jgi:hypothetical protein
MTRLPFTGRVIAAALVGKRTGDDSPRRDQCRSIG